MHSIPLDEAQRIKNPDVGISDLHSIFLDEIKRQRHTKMLECLTCILSLWMKPKGQNEPRCWSAGLHCTLLDNVRGKKTNPDAEMLGLLFTLLDETQNIEANPGVNLLAAQPVSH